MKKIIKKLVSGLVITAMALTMVPFAAFAADATDEGLIFDLDLTGSTAEGIQVSNAVADNSTTYALGSAPSTGVINGNPYLIFRQFNADGTVDNTNAGKFIKVMDENLKENDEMTFEFWARPQCMNLGQNGKVSYRMAALAVGGSSAANNRLDIFCNGANMYYRPGGESATTNYEMHSKLWNLNPNGKWTHFVFTRVWTPTSADNPSVGKWTGKVYVNGKHVAAAGTKENETTRTAEDDLYFIIGNQHYLGSSFLGDIADAKVYTTVLSDASIASKYEAEKGNFVAMEIDGISASETIDVNSGKIVVDFGAEINADTVDGITFTKADGSEIFGGYNVSVDADKVTVMYGKLEEGEDYTLTIPVTVEATDGKTMEKAVSYTFKAETSYIVNEDFTSLTEVPDMAGISFVYPSGEDALSVEQTEDGDYYLSVKSGDAAGKDYKVLYTPETALLNTDDPDTVHIVEMKFGSVRTKKDEASTGDNNVARNIMAINDTNNLKQGEMWKDNMLVYGTWNADTAGGSNTHTLVKDSNGFAHLKTAFAAYELEDGTKVLGVVNQDLQDANGFTSTLIPSATYATGKAATAFPNKISNVQLAHIYTQDSNTHYAENRFSEIKVYTRTRVGVLNAVEFNKATNSVALVLTDDLKENEENKIVVTDAEGTEVPYMATYNQANRTVTLSFDSLAEGDYNVSLAAVVDTEGIACSAKTVSFEVTGGTEAEVVYYNGADVLTSLDGATAVKAVAALRNYEGAVPTGILAVYEGERLVDAAIATSEVSGSTVTFTAEITELSALSDDTSDVKFFIWDGISTMVPVVEAEIFVAGGGL